MNNKVGRVPTFCFGPRMGTGEARLKAILQPAVEALGYELVGVEHRRGRGRGLLRAYIDKDGGVNLDDCARASHQISGVLDVEDPIAEPYDLEVSSPGLDRPLFEASHYQRFAGRRVRLRLRLPFEGRRKFTGTLIGFQDGEIRIEEEGVERKLPFDAISSARLVPED